MLPVESTLEKYTLNTTANPSMTLVKYQRVEDHVSITDVNHVIQKGIRK